jgi:hypothetical protein
MLVITDDGMEFLYSIGSTLNVDLKKECRKIGEIIFQ